MTIGRPTKYKAEFAKQAAKLCELGMTDKELADFFEVSEVTVNAWKTKHPEFLKSLKVGKGHADTRVERSLYERALGYSHPEDKIFNDSGEPLIIPTRKYYPPDTTAAIFWLKNRKKNDWKDGQNLQLSGTDENGEPTALEIRYVSSKG